MLASRGVSFFDGSDEVGCVGEEGSGRWKSEWEGADRGARGEGVDLLVLCWRKGNQTNAVFGLPLVECEGPVTGVTKEEPPVLWILREFGEQ